MKSPWGSVLHPRVLCGLTSPHKSFFRKTLTGRRAAESAGGWSSGSVFILGDFSKPQTENPRPGQAGS